MRRNMAISLPVLTLAIGIGIGIGNGYAIWRTEPIETEVIPAASLKTFSQQALEGFCRHSAVFSDFVKPDSMSDGVREQKYVTGLQMFATRLSDRGAICTVKASILTRRTQQNGSGFERSEDAHLTYLVAINGDSEGVTEEFAKALLRSQVIPVMASNLGNDGTIVPKVKVAF